MKAFAILAHAFRTLMKTFPKFGKRPRKAVKRFTIIERPFPVFDLPFPQFKNSVLGLRLPPAAPITRL